MVKLKVNGIDRSFDGDPNMPLLWYVRDVLGLTGTKFGCGIALCGACTVHKNGEAIRSCITAVKSVEGREITTLEGIGTTTHPHPLQEAFIEEGAAQCGFCINAVVEAQQICLLDVRRRACSRVGSGFKTSHEGRSTESSSTTIMQLVSSPELPFPG